MAKLTLAGDQTFRLTPTQQSRTRGWFELTVEGGPQNRRACKIPVGPDVSFVLTGRSPGVQITLAPDDVETVRLTGFNRAKAWAACHVTRHRTSTMDFGAFEIHPSGSDQSLQAYRKHLKYARKIGTRPDGDWLRTTPELMTGWTSFPPVVKVEGKARIAVALHMYYTDLWPEIATLLGTWQHPFRLFVTLNKEDPALKAIIWERFPDSDIRVVDNRGRDVRPFFVLLEDGAFSNFDFICKIHGKKSIGNGRIGIFGDMVRRATYLDLIGDGQQVTSIVDAFDQDSHLGLVGPRRFRSTTEGRTMAQRLAKNQQATEALADRLGHPLNPMTFGFFEGTMFWVRPAALEPLKALHLSDEFVAPEAGLLDGALEHALERIFNHCVEIAGYRVGDTTSHLYPT